MVQLQKMHMIQRPPCFPNDLLHLVLLAVKDDRDALLAASEVSREWRDIAARYLFGRFVVNVKSRKYTDPSLPLDCDRRFINCAQMLRDAPWITKACYEVVLRGPDDMAMPPVLTLRVFLQILTSLVRAHTVRALCLCWTECGASVFPADLERFARRDFLCMELNSIYHWTLLSPCLLCTYAARSIQELIVGDFDEVADISSKLERPRISVTKMTIFPGQQWLGTFKVGRFPKLVAVRELDLCTDTRADVKLYRPLLRRCKKTLQVLRVYMSVETGTSVLHTHCRVSPDTDDS